jgi:1-acyl-sn-glycerol-3-phosphate acyltransferase
MEKFRLFTDKATGINPFTPVRGLDKISWGRFILGFILFIGTFPLILIIESFICLYESLYTIGAVVGVQFVCRWLLGPIQYLMTRLYLIIFHHTFWSGSATTFPKNPRLNLLKSQKSDLKDDEPLPFSSQLAPGSVVVVNCQSPVDVLVLQRLFWSTPLIFAMPAGEEEGANKHTEGLWWSAFRHTTFLRLLSSTAIPSKRIKNVDVRPLQRLGAKIGRPVILFAEGTTSNGKSVLQLPETITLEGNLCDSMSLAGITYMNSAAVNATIPQAAFPFTVRVLGESILSGGNGIDCSISRPSVLAALAEQDPENILVSEPTAEVAKITSGKSIIGVKGDALQKALADTVSFERLSSQPCRVVSSSTEDKFKFYDMWVKHGNLV